MIQWIAKTNYNIRHILHILDIFKMAEAVEHVCDNHGYNRMETKFVEIFYDSRVFQKAKDSGKVLCPDCNVSQGNIQFSRQMGLNFITEESTRAKDSIMTHL